MKAVELPPVKLKDVRVDHVGSLLRPARLKEEFRRFAAGQATGEELRAAQDSAIRDVVQRQEALGLPLVTDGEYRRLNWQVSFSEIEGWDMWATSWDNFRRMPQNRAPDEKPLSKGEDAVLSFRTPVTRPLRLVRNFPLEEFQFAHRVAAKPVKVTLMGPDRVTQMSDYAASGKYPGREAFLADVVRIQREIIADLAQAGCGYVQIDEPSYTGYVDPATLERMRARGEDPLKLLKRAVDADNALMEGFKDTVFGLHVCRGNRASMWHREGKYDAIAEALFGGLKYHRLLLEYDTERAGGFEPLRFVRKGTLAVLGLITTKSAKPETVDELRRRIDQAARYLPLEQLALSPQCGFASGIAGNLLSEDEQWRKLEVMMQAARRIWQ
jgi:5-methyltetrahydropteroyltriglutamate--homocysteine methyltransferase